MKRIIAASLLAMSITTAPAFADAAKVGVLECDVSAGAGFIIGSSKEVNCTFKGDGTGRTERYTGSIGKLGIDIGVTGEASMAWIVFAAGQTGKGALEGSYGGAGAEATVGAGLGANVLVGGFERSINLQPLSVKGQTGLNIAAGLSSLTLEYVD
jgi:hypothetical protein